MKTEKERTLAQLRQLPIVEVACKKTGISRATFYRWKAKDKKFARAVNEAVSEGESLITDMSESQLISLIRDRNFPSIQFWLKTHHPKYANKLEIAGNVNIDDEPLTSEQAKVVRAALRMATFDKNHDTKKEK